jgi:inhibitor of cysteine peptidase
VKKYLALVLFYVVLLVALGAGCSSSVKTYTEGSQVINVAVNEELTIALESNPTTGFSWQSDYDKTLLNLVSNEYKAKEVDKNVVGSGGTQYFKFKALKSGKATVTLSYRRPWETPSANDKKQTFNITIK